MPASEGKKGLLRRIKVGQPSQEASEEPSRESQVARRPSASPPARASVPPTEQGAAGQATHARREDEFLSPGDTLQDRYEIRKFISKGGMGAVYLARDTRFPKVEKLVAVKEMIRTIRDSVTSRISLETFEREANIVASLNHSAIPKVFDYFHHERRVYLILEFIEGTDLESLLTEMDYPIPQEKVVDWAIQTCDVLTYLHNHQPSPIVFRDMKPSNIMLRHDGSIVLIDFGIAKIFQEGKRGTMIGTEGYSPPEQYRGISEPRGDIYALGATLHHLLTRRDPRKEPPFTFNEHPANAFNPSVTTELQAILSRALAYELEERYPSAHDMQLDLLKVARASDRPQSALISQVSLGSDEREPTWYFTCEDEIRSTPAVYENAVYFGAYDKSLYSLEAPTGKERWKYATDGGIVSSPCVWNDTVFFGSEDQILYAVYVRTGRIVWTCPTKGRIRSSPKPEYDHVFFGSDDHHLYAVSAKLGQELWRFDAEAPVRSSPAITGEYIIFGCDDGAVYALDVQSGDLRWKYQTGRSVQSSPTVALDMAFVGSADSSLYALDLENGWPLWRHRTKGRVISSPVVAGNMIFFGSNDQHVYAADARTGAPVWKYATKGPVVSSPQVHNEAVYVGSADGHLYSLAAKTGNLLWRFETGGPITGSPAVGAGMVYVGSADHTLYAFPIGHAD